MRAAFRSTIFVTLTAVFFPLIISALVIISPAFSGAFHSIFGGIISTSEKLSGKITSADDFEKMVTSKYGNKIDYDFVFQELDDLPTGFKPPPARDKPWGTGHAVWVARNKIKGPFAVINADDFYGSESYKTMVMFFKRRTSDVGGEYSMVGFNLQNTLSEYGSVSRGICKVKDGHLLDIDERTNIRKQGGLPVYTDENGAIKHATRNVGFRDLLLDKVK